MNIKAVLVDDEIDSIGAMLIQLNRHCPLVHVIGSFTSSEEAYEFLAHHEVDILFVDIEMPRLNGFELLSKLGKFTFKVVFVTAYDQFGIKAVKFQAFDYLLKPVDPEELKEVVKKYAENITIGHDEDSLKTKKSSRLSMDDKLLIPVGSEYEFIPMDSIIRCESDDNYTLIHLIDKKKIIVSKTLKLIESKLPIDIFLRVHSSHLINIHYISSYHKSDGGYFELINGENIPLSRSRKDEILKILGIG